MERPPMSDTARSEENRREHSASRNRRSAGGALHRHLAPTASTLEWSWPRGGSAGDPDDAAEKITTVKDAIDYIEKQKGE